MGGGNSKDDARIHYRIHNIYLNFINTYERIQPNIPLTIHQKGLFCFWISVLLLLITLQIVKLVRKIQTKYKQKSDNGELRSRDKQNSAEIENATQGKVTTHSQQKTPKIVIGMSENKSLLKNSDNKQEIITDDMDDTDEDNKKKTLLQNICNFFSATTKEQPSFDKFILRLSIFGAIMFYFWLCDSLHFWPKVEKQYSRDVFIFIFAILILVSFVFTLRTNNDKVLNRDQTEEWKGWMQVQFVWYHYFDAQEVYNSIRCYIAAYVWMTGFGNLSFFWTKQDYSIFRLLKMLFRLNFLVIFVMVVNNHEFVRYYICAMHTYWFISVWAVLVVFNKHNKNRKFMALKFAIYAIINAIIFDIPGLSWKIFIPLNFILHDHEGGLRYWIYRSTLDHWTTIVGMLVAYNYPYYEKFLMFLDKKDNRNERIFKESLRIGLTFLAIAIFIMWFNWALLIDRTTYIKIHPYTSPIPILVYIWLRNVHPLLRRRHLNLLTWLGKITLETYLSQIHIYMMGDAHQIIVYIPNYPLLNFMLATCVYLSVSYTLFHLTVFFSSYLVPRDLKIIGKNIVIAFLWLSVSHLLAFALTLEYKWGEEKTGLEFLLWNVTKS
eukprot:gene15358-16935_t